MERLNLMLSKDQIDVIATTNERSGGPIFYSDVYIRYQNVAVALRSRNLDIQRISDLVGYSLPSRKRARFLLGSEFQAMAENNPRYREEAFQIARNRMLYSGRVDVVVTDMRILRYFNREVYTKVDVTQPLALYPIFAATDYKLGCRQQAHCERFNQGLAEIRESGEDRLIERRYAMHRYTCLRGLWGGRDLVEAFLRRQQFFLGLQRRAADAESDNLDGTLALTQQG